MHKFNLILIFFIIQLVGCNHVTVKEQKEEMLIIPWWESVKPIVIGHSEFYGSTCSVTQVIRNVVGIKSENIIFKVPPRLFTHCAEGEPGRNYLEHDGEYIILNVYRQTIGAGSWTGERYRSTNFKIWEEYIGVTWVEGEEYEAWRRVGSTSSKAITRTKVVK